jgi:type VI secretion system protein ImpL
MPQAQQQLQAASGLGGQPGSPAVLAQIQNALGALQADAAQMPPVIAGLIDGLTGQSKQVAMGVAHSDLEARYQSQVVSQCRELLGSRYPFNRSNTSDVTLEDFARVFGGGGIYDTFFQANLAALVDISHANWRWKEGAEAIGGSSAMLAQFQAAEGVRKVFFKPGGQMPEVRFTITPGDLAEGVDRFHLKIDGQTLDYSSGPQNPVSMTWPGGPVGQVLASLEEPTGAHPEVKIEGPWAFFRLLDQATVQPQSETLFVVTIPVNGKWARVKLQAASIRNPFARQDAARFHCG